MVEAQPANNTVSASFSSAYVAVVLDVGIITIQRPIVRAGIQPLVDKPLGRKPVDSCVLCATYLLGR
ncbi:MAG: hypothetical protein ACYTBJ_14670 [Planctomycetota bacterium]|jgi:hypothetical protein